MVGGQVDHGVSWELVACEVRCFSISVANICRKPPRFAPSAGGIDWRNHRLVTQRSLEYRVNFDLEIQIAHNTLLILKGADVSDLELQHVLLRKLVRLQKLNLWLISGAGIVWAVHFLQGMLYTPILWLLLPFPLLIIASAICRRKCKCLKIRLNALGFTPEQIVRWEA